MSLGKQLEDGITDGFFYFLMVRTQSYVFIAVLFFIPFGSSVADPHGEDEEKGVDGLQHWASFDVVGT